MTMKRQFPGILMAAALLGNDNSYIGFDNLYMDASDVVRAKKKRSSSGNGPRNIPGKPATIQLHAFTIHGEVIMAADKKTAKKIYSIRKKTK